eukprot:TRINITY_DN3665_c0_g1_i1.p1 TRINITY_DN3665_c0_g1~~TRINITY_DN3665_c0_g1_i1.p1  ORF type:complete len:306 (+),score=61.25 TRINITY_DN3665_c0_g1_i1:146-1063(+)
MSLPQKVIDSFWNDGIAVAENFCTVAECDAMMGRMKQLIDEWNPADHPTTNFVTTDAHVNNEYFFDSADKIRFFLEPQATKDTPKHERIHKVGHGLHRIDPVFKEYSTCKKVGDLAKSLGWKDPVLPQSMYIFKQPLIGDAAPPHQDSTFLYTTPRMTCLGLWLALQDATEDNGCLWAKKGSHKDGIEKIFSRNKDYFEKGDKTAAALTFVNAPGTTEKEAGEFQAITTKEEALKAGYTPLPVKAGDVVLIHGEVYHLSLGNKSDASRHTFQLHLIEGPSEGVTWSPTNWLQYPEGEPFPKLGQQ